MYVLTAVSMHECIDQHTWCTYEFMKVEMNGIDTCSHVTDVSILAEHLHACYACLYTYACRMMSACVYACMLLHACR